MHACDVRVDLSSYRSCLVNGCASTLRRTTRAGLRWRRERRLSEGADTFTCDGSTVRLKNQLPLPASGGVHGLLILGSIGEASSQP